MLIDIDGTEIHIVEPEIQGMEKNPALLLIHGAGGDASTWSLQADFFKGKYPVYIMELPGHGSSGGSGEKEIPAYVEWVRKALKQIVPDRPLILAGHSMGGAIVQELALSPPLNLKGIVLVGTGAKLGVMPDIFEMLENNPESFFRTIGVAAFHLDTPPETRAPFIQAIRKCPPSIIHGDFKACDRFDIRERLKDIKLSALILCGDRDKLTPVKYSEYLYENLASSRLEIIDGAGHMVMVEQSGSVNPILERFLEGIEP